ncbi:MAG TPA: histidinol dehydrogenase [Clostridiales bacterium]|jgi:histidinol dehydrogenase|nr:histidinol dehydrogenase [Clostridiales bacterium]
MRIINAGSPELEAFLEKLTERAADAMDANVSSRVAEIVDSVKNEGDAALRRLTAEFDGVETESLSLPQAALEAAWEAAAPELKAALEQTKAAILEYHRPQIPEDYEIVRPDGSRLRMLHRGLDRVGLYVPGGTAAYPSTVLMNALPAKLAGVGELIMVTPPAGATDTAPGGDVVLAAAWLAGVDRVFRVGGAQAIAALAYGTESIPAVDKIVGPGNQYVALAKRQVYGLVDIDSFAGPSEILVLADHSAPPEWVAADLLSQAEHDKQAASIMITTDPELADLVAVAVERRVEQAERGGIIRASIENYSAIILCNDEAEMMDLTNRIAPEHLEIMTADPQRQLVGVRNAGSVFLGPWSPEVLGDYTAGVNHVLPTAGTARFASPLGVYSFIKRMSVIEYTKEGLAATQEAIVTLTDCEGLPAHGEAAVVRKNSCNPQADVRKNSANPRKGATRCFK